MADNETSAATAASASTASDRRHRSDRRTRGGESRRGQRPVPAWQKHVHSTVGYLFAAAALVSVILFAVSRVNPIYASRAPLVEQVLARGTMRQAPVDTSEMARLMASPQFARDHTAFSEDLVRTGRMSKARADSIAFYAVRESYERGIPPALIFGVMLTENAQFISRATSNVGAVGLMQIYPKVWLKALSGKFGSDLENDETNMKYGVYILEEYLKPTEGEGLRAAQVRKGLLRYNGCVRGTNTPNCKTYPDKIERYVERDAQSLCRGQDFYDCIARPFIRGLLGEQNRVEESAGDVEQGLPVSPGS
ncbi:MAG TPA: lytic transglycosylase domain-containing protein [Gemmatimonadaceae bacterium]|nr:lytic transglycosylase domain-containing protein [Gemmatimonadaceae bacterium]